MLEIQNQMLYKFLLVAQGDITAGNIQLMKRNIHGTILQAETIGLS